jgi:phage host-nuclease inhibitor protein Gam
MSRKKPAPAVLFKNLEEVDTALSEIADIERDLGRVEAQMNKHIDRVKADAEKIAEPLRRRVAALENALTVYGETHKAELFDKRRSIELAFGTIGFRQSSELKPLPKMKWDDVLALIKQKRVLTFIRVKEEVNKEAFDKLQSAEELAVLGVRRVEKDTFWYETKKEEVKDAG